MQSLMPARSIVATRRLIRRRLKHALPNDPGATERPAFRVMGQRPTKTETEAKTVFMFPGEGSQYFQMGEDLYRNSPLFQECMLEMDQIVRELCGYSVLQLLYEHGHKKSETFDRTLLSHPAIFMVQYATARVLIASGVEPDLTLGTGIGSFAAAVVSGYLRMEDALMAVIRQAAMFEARCARGGMLAVLNDPQLHAESLRQFGEVAAINLPGHFVVSAPHEALSKIEESLRAKGVTLQKLAVPFAFHSHWIDEAKEPFMRFMERVVCRPGEIPMMCSFGCEMLNELPMDYFWRAMREPVRFHKAIEELESRGTFRYVDIGPSAMLSMIVTRALPGCSASTALATLTPFGHDMKNISALIAGAE